MWDKDPKNYETHHAYLSISYGTKPMSEGLKYQYGFVSVCLCFCECKTVLNQGDGQTGNISSQREKELTRFWEGSLGRSTPPQHSLSTQTTKFPWVISITVVLHMQLLSSG